MSTSFRTSVFARTAALIAATHQKDAIKRLAETTAMQSAIATNLDPGLAQLDEDALRVFFAGMEAAATAAQRTKIALHPLRPEGVDALVAQADAEREKAAEEAKAAKQAERERKERERWEELDAKYGKPGRKNGGDTAAAD